MSSAKITLMGLYHFLKYDNIDLFSNLILPEGIDKDAVVANILQKGSEFEVIYPDAEYLQNSIKYWSQKWYWSFDKWVKLINTKYDPLFNYDRTERWTDDNTHEDEHTTTSTKDSTTSGSYTDTNETNAEHDIVHTKTNDISVATSASEESEGSAGSTGSNQVEVQKSAFDSSTYQPYEYTVTATGDESTTSGSSSSEGSTTQNESEDYVQHDTDVSTSNGSGTTSGTGKDEYTENHATDGTYKTIHEGRMFGNIGVMSSQDMFNQEINVAYFNLYDRITEIFLNEYTIPIYI